MVVLMSFSPDASSRSPCWLQNWKHQGWRTCDGMVLLFCEPLSWFAVTRFCDKPLCRSNLITWSKGRHSRSQWPRGLRRRSAPARLLRLWVQIPPGGMDVVNFVCCQVEVCATSWSLVQRIPTVVRRCVWYRNLVNEEALAHGGAVAPKERKRGTHYAYLLATEERGTVSSICANEDRVSARSRHQSLLYN
jgi:hypothetical protein